MRQGAENRREMAALQIHDDIPHANSLHSGDDVRDVKAAPKQQAPREVEK